MEGERGGRLGSFLIGGLVGSLAGLAAAGRMRMRDRRRTRPAPAGLAGFEEAPCVHELIEREAADRTREDAPSLR